MLPNLNRITLLIIAIGTCTIAMAQPPTTPRDTTRRPNGITPPASQGPKPYKEVITDKAKTDDGLFKVHKIEDKYFFEIPDSLMNRDILVVNRISKAAAGMRVGGFFGYAGDQIGQNVIRFQKGPNNKVFLLNISFAEYAKDSTSPMFTAVNNSNIQPIAAAFDIKSLGKDSTGVVIEVTDYINGDNDILHFNSGLKTNLRLASIQADKSYIVGVKSYPINVEIKTVKTYSRTPAPPAGGGFGGGAAPGNMTVELNSSLVLLPKTPMQARYFDRRVGYFTVGYTDYDANPQGVESISLAKRWRLEPKDEDMEKYKRGELVEPKKPIVYYIDPATPKKWIPYLIQGVNDWQASFEKAGFKNAIMAKLAPTWKEDSTWSLDDARNSAIVYKPSDIANASGPSISDPRSGEIMESHINWYHNVMQLIHDWYMIQTAPNDPKARKMLYDDELMGQLIRFVSSHEVGHTLGLRHNFGSSSTVPVENLRNKAWVEANGHTPSIMDYARFNYVAQPEDNISQTGLFPRIGDYDNWAIQWGYSLFPQFKSPEEEQGYLNKWVIEKLKNHRLWFGDGELNQDDPRNQSEDLSDDVIKASLYGIKNLKRIVPNLLEWTKEDNKDYQSLDEVFRQLTGQFSRYMIHVARNVGGIYLTPKTVEEAGVLYENEPKAKQKDAVAFLNSQLFATPTWLIDNSIYDRTGGSPITTIGTIQDNALNRLFNNSTLNKLIQAEAKDGAQSYTITELFSDVKKGIWGELVSKKSIDVYRRNLQKSYVIILDRLLNPQSSNAVISGPGVTITLSSSNDKSDIRSVVRAHLSALKNEVNAAAAAISDPMSKYHLQDVSKRIDKALNPKE
ncbi:MAG: zinc-dependent metalloprotease [Bacteroidota bacterium]